MNQKLADLRRAAVVASLRTCNLFNGLRPDDLAAVADQVSIQPLARGEYLFHEGDPAVGFYLVQKGAINVHRVNASGKEQVVHVFRAGETFAEAALATDKGYPADARAVESSQVLLIRKAGFVDLLKRQPEIVLRLLASMSLHLRILLSQLEDLTLKDVETRLASWLLKRCPEGTAQRDERVEIQLPGTKRALAGELGTVSETFSRTLAKLKAQELIQVRGTTVILLSPLRLGKLLSRNLGE